jgi:hypothetical protein
MSQNFGSSKHNATSTRSSSPQAMICSSAQSQGMVAVMECLHHDPVGLRAQFGDFAGLGGIGSKRLSAQHVLARGKRSSGPPAVQAVGQRVRQHPGEFRFSAVVRSSVF